jgi:hypothetical protein
MASEYSGYDYEEDPVMWDSPENNFADLNESPDYEALSELRPPRRSSVGRVSEEFSFPAPGEAAQFSPSPLMTRLGRDNGGQSHIRANHEQQRHLTQVSSKSGILPKIREVRQLIPMMSILRRGIFQICNDRCRH